MKYIILLADGMADRPVDSLGNRTPLEAAHTPNMDALFKQSIAGLVTPLVQGFPLGSDIGNMSILGNDPHDYYTGRAPMEASNLGIELSDSEVAFRCNLVTVKSGIMVDYSSGHITTAEAKSLIKLIDKKLGSDSVKFYPGKSYRHIMVMKGGENTIATAPHDITGEKIVDFMPKGAKSEQLIRLMDDSQMLLDGHEVNTKRRTEGKNPANMIWLWGQGKKLDLPKLKDRYRLNGAVISAVDLVNGIGRSMGLEVINVPGATGFIDTNFSGKAEYALKALKKKDFVYLHVEATDEMGHIGDVAGKIVAIEKIDKEVVGPLVEGMKSFKEYKIMVTSDHATPVVVKTHTADPVAFMIYDSRSSQSSNHEGFSEKMSALTGVTYKNGWELFDYFIKN